MLNRFGRMAEHMSSPEDLTSPRSGMIRTATLRVRQEQEGSS